MNNYSGSTFNFDVYVVCASQPKGYLILSSSAVDNPPGTESTAVVTCPTGVGLKALGGGGWSNSGSVDVNLNSSFPVKSAHPTAFSWRVQMNNTSSSDATVTAFVVCGKEAGYAIKKSKPASVGIGAQDLVEAACPLTSVPLGGGVQDESGYVFTNLSSSYPILHNVYWAVFENNSDSVQHTIRAYVTCAS